MTKRELYSRNSLFKMSDDTGQYYPELVSGNEWVINHEGVAWGFYDYGEGSDIPEGIESIDGQTISKLPEDGNVCRTYREIETWLRKNTKVRFVFWVHDDGRVTMLHREGFNFEY